MGVSIIAAVLFLQEQDRTKRGGQQQHRGDMRGSGHNEHVSGARYFMFDV